MRPVKKAGASNDGKAAEEFARAVFVRLQETREFWFMRLYDSTSAKGNPIPAQISDFFAVFERTAMSLEVKSSVKFKSLRDAPRSYIRATQVAKGKLLARAGGCGYFIFVVPSSKFFEIYTAGAVSAWFYAETRRTKLASPITTGKGKDELYSKLLQVF